MRETNQVSQAKKREMVDLGSSWIQAMARVSREMGKAGYLLAIHVGRKATSVLSVQTRYTG